MGFVGQLNLGDEVLWQEISRAFDPLRLAYAPLPKNKFIRTMVQSRRHPLVVLGGGTLIGANMKDGTNPFREEFQAVLARANRAVVFGTGVGKLSDVTSENKWLLEWKPLLANCDYIGVRGPDSVRSLESIGVQAEVLGDPACLVAQDDGFWSPRVRTLGVNIGLALGEKAKLVELVMIEQMTKFISNKIKEGWRVEFFVVCPQDLQAVNKVIEEVGIRNTKIHKIFDTATPYLEAVRSMSAFVGMKLHAVILAMCAGVPSLMIEYAPKCRDFMMSVDMQEFSINIKDVSHEKLENCLDRLLLCQKQTASNITNRMVQLREKQLRKVAEIQSQYV